jgi:DNA-binding CsgD family transcriptional regulator
MTTGYIICLIAALGLLVAYSVVVKTKEFWLTMLHVCVAVVNLGYLLMSLANTVEFAVIGNDVAYLGSVFLSMCMFLTIVRLCGFEIKKSHVITCVSLGAVMFAVIASSPMLPLYYKSVDIEMIDGATKLVKEYGVLHPVYLFYLLGYFASMIGTIIHSVRKKKIGKPKLAVFIAAIVCGNLVIWLFEKMVRWEYEFLSVTYIISEFLLLSVYWMLQDYVYKNDIPKPVPHEEKVSVIFMDSRERAEKIKQIIASLPEGTMLTARQVDILEGILEGKSRKEMAADLHLSENTVKMHTTSLFKILKVTSREEIIALIKA